MTSGVVLASATSPTEQAVFSELVQRGVHNRLLRPYPQIHRRQITHLWPLQDADHVNTDQIEQGGYVLFYRGSNRYTWGARVRAVARNADLAGDLYRYIRDADTPDFQDGYEFSDTVLVLDVPVRIDLESYQLHDLIGLDQDALTRTIVLRDGQIEGLVDEYGSLDRLLQSARVAPNVYVELTSVEDKPYKQPDGEYPLGTAVFSRSESDTGADIYATMREPEVGDLVLHVLKDTRELRGLSTVASTLQKDFEGPPDDSWNPEARGSGYYLPLAGYHEFEDPIDIDADLLENDDYRDRLETIYENNTNLVYDKNLDFVEGAYFTECPLALLYLCITEEPTILTIARTRFWEVPLPDPAEKYTTVSDAVVDVRVRLPFDDRDHSWFLEQFATTVVKTLTDSLSSVEPSTELTQTEAVHCDLIRKLYTDREAEFEETASRLGVAATNQVDRAGTLFFVLFRELQAAVGATTNMNQVKTRTILGENYTVESPEISLPDPDTTEPLEPADMPGSGEEIARQLERTGQVVFYGPPGTGKTYTALRFVRWWLNEQPDVEPHTGHLETITFHPSFTYEDFIEGIEASTTEGGQVTYGEEPGVFLNIAQTARDAYLATPDNEEPPKYVILIDEINRGNLAQIFGETMTALEYDKRLDQPNETTVSLAHTGAPFRIPPNLYLIGTMNTADRSIALVDTALRRRFRFIAFPPNFKALYPAESVPFESAAAVEQAATTESSPHRLLALSILAVQRFNDTIINSPDLGKGKQIGHSYFFGTERPADIVDLWRFEILPLLEEYYFGQFDRIRENLFNGGGRDLLDYDTEQIKDFDAPTLERTLVQLLSLDIETTPDSGES